MNNDKIKYFKFHCNPTVTDKVFRGSGPWLRGGEFFEFLKIPKITYYPSKIKRIKRTASFMVIRQI